MGKQTSISWTERTFNPWWGCTKVSPGCDNCYAETLDGRYSETGHWGKGAKRRIFGEKHWQEPIHWNSKAAADGVNFKVFCASMGDVMDDEAPEGERERLWELINNTPNLEWQLLTKRPHRFERYLPSDGFEYDNVMLMATVELQVYLEPRVSALRDASSELMRRNSRKRGASLVGTGISYEPAIGPLTIRNHVESIDWVIFGGETGSSRRPMQEQWARDIKAECEEAGTAFFMKQMSAFSPTKASDLIPADLLIRQFPER